MKNKKLIMVCASRFAFGGHFGVLASRSLTAFEMTAKQKKKKHLAAAKPPLNAPLSHMQHVISNAVRDLAVRKLLKPLQVNNFTSLLFPYSFNNKGIRAMWVWITARLLRVRSKIRVFDFKVSSSINQLLSI